METRSQRKRSARPPGEQLRLRTAALWWLALFGVWFVLVASLVHAEVAAGPAAATIALVAVLGVSAHVRREFHARFRWLGALRPVPVAIVGDTLTVFRALFRQVIGRERMHGEFRVVPFPRASREESEDAAWRAFSIIGTSVAPNTYIIGIDEERRTALVHQLVATSPEDLRRGVIGSTSTLSSERRRPAG